jgi:hypothetical protein
MEQIWFVFPNDINVLITDIDVGSLQNKVDQVIIIWLLVSKNDLIVNVGKTVVMLFHSRQKKVSTKTSSFQ